MKAKEIKEMSSDQRESLLKETIDKLYKLRIQANMERLDSPSEVQKCKKLIAQIKTIQRDVEIKEAKAKANADADSKAEANA